MLSNDINRMDRTEEKFLISRYKLSNNERINGTRIEESVCYR